MKKLKNNAGFSLGEMLLVMLILLLATGIVAGGIPAAANAYYKAVDGANAQILLSTTKTCLRDELALASEIKVSDDQKTVSYTGADGRTYEIYNTNNTEGVQGIMVKDTSVNGTEHFLVSSAAATPSLYSTYKSISYTNGIVTVRGLKVNRKDKDITIISLEEVCIQSIQK